MAGSPKATKQDAPVGGFRRIWRAARQLFHEMIGATFAVLALAWLSAALRASRSDVAHWLIATAVAVAAMMAIFSWISFRKSRRVR